MLPTRWLVGDMQEVSIRLQWQDERAASDLDVCGISTTCTYQKDKQGFRAS